MAVVQGDITEGPSSESIWVELRNKMGMITLVGEYYSPTNSQQEIEK